ncbi:MAG: hypothetical protein J0H01_22170 [Rhizobiales bacterium]|nr:hypothetical protein [Hyphomicrobiales bacterium]
MSLPVWPAALPQEYAQEQYSRAARFKPNTTEMEDGPVTSRRQSRIKARREAVYWIMDGAQVELLETFFDDDLKSGAARFTMPTFSPSAASFTARTCHFEGERPDVTPLGGGNWGVSGKITVYY